ncbi:hypothetical protein [Malikia sp.]|uniref:hypothetical protein n=1 Tax=Malikia sp. TaxID=2070706 RepID=UPI0026301FA6|nr:hypothetical protein [Malikia sp.]MDD2728182.1 hypothetical protein [Malikia sp.]
MTLDTAAMVAGSIGFLLLVIGVGAIYWPAGLIIAGLFLLAWSFLVARAVARQPAAELAHKPGSD